MFETIISEKSFVFAIKIVKFCKKLLESREFVISNQLLRSGTSVGANVEEAKYAQSKKDFIAKQSIALKEAAESKYWLKILLEVDEVNNEEVKLLIEDCYELIRMLTASIKKSKASL